MLSSRCSHFVQCQKMMEQRWSVKDQIHDYRIQHSKTRLFSMWCVSHIFSVLFSLFFAEFKNEKLHLVNSFSEWNHFLYFWCNSRRELKNIFVTSFHLLNLIRRFFFQELTISALAMRMFSRISLCFYFLCWLFFLTQDERIKEKWIESVDLENKIKKHRKKNEKDEDEAK